VKFQAEWFLKWLWFHYHENDDMVFYHTCVKVFKELNMHIRNAEDAFISRGFSNWKLVTNVFRQHGVTNCRKETVEKIVTLPAMTSDIGERFSKAHAQEKCENCKVLLKILSNLRFLARQVCAIRGDGNETDNSLCQCIYDINNSWIKQTQNGPECRDKIQSFPGGHVPRPPSMSCLWQWSWQLLDI